jgi:hypothetical protein
MASSSTSPSASIPALTPVQASIKMICGEHDKNWFVGKDKERSTYATIATAVNKQWGLKKDENEKFTAEHIYNIILEKWVEGEDIVDERDMFGRKEKPKGGPEGTLGILKRY